MSSQYDAAKNHFDSVSQQWNKLYSDDNVFLRAYNKMFRKGIYDRFDFAFEKCTNLKDSSVLDIGSGTGAYCIEFASREAKKVVGIDIAPSMVEYSKSACKKFGVSEKCEFICGNILDHNFSEQFDYIIAMGFFDYSNANDSELLFETIAKLKPKKFIASFPKYTLLWGLQRHIRYQYIKNCPIYYYKEDDVIESFKSLGCSNHEIISSNTMFVLSVEFN